MDEEKDGIPEGEEQAFGGDQSALERSKRTLYRRGSPETPVGFRHRMHRLAKATVPGGWRPKPKSAMNKFFQSPLTWLLGIATVFFLGSFAFLVFSLLTDRSVISSENIDILVQGPVSIAAGEELGLQIVITNNNPVAIQAADLIVGYPLGARRADDARTPIERADRSFIGTLLPGQSVNRTLDVVLFGETDEEQAFDVGLEYRAEGSNAVVQTNKEYTIPLSAAPVSLSVTLPENISTDEDFEGEIEIRSNASTVLEDVRVSIKYPPGFQFLDSDPQPTSGQTTFDLGDLLPGAKRSISFNGSLIGQDNELKTFAVTAGSAQGSADIDVPFNSTLHTLTIVRPSLEAVITINNHDENPAVLGVNENVEGLLTITNNHENRVIDLEANLLIAGDVLNPNSVNAFNGFFRSLDRTIIWDRGGRDFSGELGPGEILELPFSFLLIPPASRVNIANARELSLDLSISGQLVKPDESANLEVFSSNSIRVNSDLALSARNTHFTGPISNTGPIPPRVNQPTTYTAFWAITNGTNDMRNVRVVAKLPQYARYTGVVSPESETIRFNSQTNELTWDAGIVRAGTGTTRPVREVAFQVEVIPSAPQVANILTVVGEAAISGVDTFTNATLQGTTRSLNTILVTDPQYQEGMGVVAP